MDCICFVHSEDVFVQVCACVCCGLICMFVSLCGSVCVMHSEDVCVFV